MSLKSNYPCQCGKIFTSPSALTQHQASHKPGPPFRCPHCNKPFTTTSSLQQHQKSHNKAKPNPTAATPSTKTPPAYAHMCHCLKRFTSASALRQHRKSTHYHQRRCQRSGKTFGPAPEMHTPDQEQKQKCRCSCGKRFKSAEGMAEHRQESKAHMDPVDNVRRLQEKKGGREEKEVRHATVGFRGTPGIGGVQYSRFSDIAIGTTQPLRSSKLLPVGRAKVDPAKTGGKGVDHTVGERMDWLPADVVAGLKELLELVEAESGTVDDDGVNPEEQEGVSSAVPRLSGAGGRDLTMCDGDCGWCGECGDEYRP